MADTLDKSKNYGWEDMGFKTKSLKLVKDDWTVVELSADDLESLIELLSSS